MEVMSFAIITADQRVFRSVAAAVALVSHERDARVWPGFLEEFVEDATVD